MTEVFGLQILFFVIVIIIAILFIYYVIFKVEDTVDYEKQYQELQEHERQSLFTLDDGNKEINEIEEKILECKKKLNMKLFK